MKEDDTILTLWEKLKRRAKKQINIKDKENIKQLDWKARFARVRAAREWSASEGRLLVPQWSEPTPWTRPQMPPGPKTSSPHPIIR